MNTVVSWIRRVYPPWWAVVFVLLGYGLLEGIYLKLGQIAELGVEESLAGILCTRDGWIVFACIAYATYRVWYFHPVVWADYRRWLELTPWHVSKPLPLGPVHVVPQDILMLGAMRAMLHDYQLPETALPHAFLASYVSSAAIVLWRTGMRGSVYALVFGMGLVLRVYWWQPIVALGLLLLLFGLTSLELKRSLARFPWADALQRLDTALRGMKAASAHLDRHSQEFGAEFKLPVPALGWPFQTLIATNARTYLERHDRVAIALLVGWLLYVVAASPEIDSEQQAGMVMVSMVYLVCPCAIGRIIIYCRNHWPPISLWGRLWTGRWIIPQYDCAFVAPILTLLIGVGSLLILLWIDARGVSLAGLAGGLVSIALLVTFTMGPSYERWRLTAPCRIGPGLGRPSKWLDEI